MAAPRCIQQLLVLQSVPVSTQPALPTATSPTILAQRTRLDANIWTRHCLTPWMRPRYPMGVQADWRPWVWRQLEEHPVTFETPASFPLAGLHTAVCQIEFDHLGALVATSTSNGLFRLYDFDELRAFQSLVRNASATNGSAVLNHVPTTTPVSACGLN